MTDSHPPLTGLALAHGAVDRCGAKRDDADWVAQRWAAAGSCALLVAAGRVPYVERDGQVALAWRPTSQTPPGERYLLGLDVDGLARFAVSVDHLPEQGTAGDLRGIGGLLSPLDAELLVHAVALTNWHAGHQRCPRCGEPTEVVKAGAERRCVADGSAHFPRTDPAVIVLVTDPQGRALLGRQAGWPVGRFSTLAGFVEPGESAEHAVIREVAEESGLTVFDVRYLGSQPWPFPASLMLGFTARAEGRRPKPDGDELVDVRWFDRTDYRDGVVAGSVVPPGGISIARRLIERWYGGPLPQGPEVWR
jgi:NAD+ diphosphatase